MKENSIEEDIEVIESIIEEYENCCVPEIDMQVDVTFREKQNNALNHILLDYKNLQEEFKQIDHECERLEEKEVRIIKENEHYEDLINALETYYNITREDLEECIKNDK